MRILVKMRRRRRKGDEKKRRSDLEILKEERLFSLARRRELGFERRCKREGHRREAEEE